MKTPPAPVSSSAFVLMILSFCSFVVIEIGSEIDLFKTLATMTLEIYIDEELEVKASLHFKNPG